MQATSPCRSAWPGSTGGCRGTRRSRSWSITRPRGMQARQSAQWGSGAGGRLPHRIAARRGLRRSRRGPDDASESQRGPAGAALSVRLCSLRCLRAHARGCWRRKSGRTALPLLAHVVVALRPLRAMFGSKIWEGFMWSMGTPRTHDTSNTIGGRVARPSGHRDVLRCRRALFALFGSSTLARPA